MDVWKVRLWGDLELSCGDRRITRFRTRATSLVFIRLALAGCQRLSRSSLIDLIWPNSDVELGRQSLRTALSDIRSRLGTHVLDADTERVGLIPTFFDIDVERFLESRCTDNYEGWLLRGWDESWISDRAQQLHDQFVDLALVEMSTLNAEEAIALASRCLDPDPHRLDVKQRLAELGLATKGPVTSVPDTSFIGRERELSDIEALLDSHRLITLSGLGGAGKTRLAEQIFARRQPEAWFVRLSDLVDGSQVAEAIRRRLRLNGGANRPAIDQIASVFADQRGLLILDNFEHVLTGRAVVQELLERCPGLSILATSQALLGLEHEIDYPVGPIADSDSIELFMARASAVSPAFQLNENNRGAIAALCRRLDGFPLAIEIAAAKARIFTPHEMLSEVEDRFEFLKRSGRHASRKYPSLLAALEWSFERLEVEEQTLLTDLTIFRGGFTLKAASRVCGSENIEAHLESLLAHAWVERVASTGKARFRLLESVREFASEMVTPARLSTLRRTHADWCLEFGEYCHDHVFQPEEEAAHTEAEIEFANLEAAWDYLRKSDGDGALALLIYTNWFFVLRGMNALGEARAREALSIASSEPSELLAFGHHVLGDFILFQGRFAEAEPWYHQALAMYEAVGGKRYWIMTLQEVGYICAELGRFEEAEQWLERALSRAQDFGNANWIGCCYCLLTLLHNRQGRWREATQVGRLGLNQYRLGGYRWGLASTLNEVAYAYRKLGDLEAAIAMEEEAISIKRALQSRRSLAISLDNLAAVYLVRGELEAAEECVVEAIETMVELGDTYSLPSLYETASHLANAKGGPEVARRAEEIARALQVPLADRDGVQVSLIASLNGEYVPERAEVQALVAAIRAL